MSEEKIIEQPQGAIEKPVVTEEVAKQFRGRVPKSISKEVVELNRAKRATLRKDGRGNVAEVPRLNLFMEEFLKNGGNGTEAALKVFNAKSRASASATASYYLKKAKELGRFYLDNRGVGYGRLLDIAVEKTEKSKTPEWWDRLMKIGGYEDFFAKPGGSTSVSVNILQSQKRQMDEFGFSEGEIVEGEEEKEGEDVAR